MKTIPKTTCMSKAIELSPPLAPKYLKLKLIRILPSPFKMYAEEFIQCNAAFAKITRCEITQKVFPFLP